MFSPTTTQALAAKSGILRKRRCEGGPQVVPMKRVRFADTSSVPPSPSPAPAPKPSPSPTRPGRRVDWGPALPPVEAAAVRAARVSERNQWWDEEIKRLKARRLEEAEKKKAAAVAAAMPVAEPAEPIQPTTFPSTSEVGVASRMATAIYGFFVSFLWGIQTWWHAKVTGPFNRFLNDEKVNDCLDEICVFFGERAVFVFLVVFSLLLIIIIYSYKMVKWCVNSADMLWLGGLDGLRSGISLGPDDYHRRRQQPPPWMIASAGINPEEDDHHEQNIDMSARTYHEVYHRHEQYTAMRAGADSRGYYRREQRFTCHMGTSARIGKEQYYPRGFSAGVEKREGSRR